MLRSLIALSFIVQFTRGFGVTWSRSTSEGALRRSPVLSATISGSSASLVSMKQINGLSDIVDSFDVFLLDMWGVLHDGSKPYDGVLETVQQLKKRGKRLVILSNSSKRQDNSIKMLKKLGFNPEDFEQIITSGEVAYQILSGARHSDVTSQLANKNVFVFGSGDGDAEYCNSCGWTLTPIEQASLIIARGTFTTNDGSTIIDKRLDPSAYDKMVEKALKESARSRIPMFVCNPDKLRPDGDMSPMPGQIGDMYESLLGAGADEIVHRIGKPFPLVYDIALAESSIDRSRAIMIGDALETDVTGGSICGIPTLWVLLTGIHAPELTNDAAADVPLLCKQAAEILKGFNGKQGTYAKSRQLSPDYVVPNFRW